MLVDVAYFYWVSGLLVSIHKEKGVSARRAALLLIVVSRNKSVDAPVIKSAGGTSPIGPGTTL